MTLTYSQYLKIDELLKLQNPRSGGAEHDEMLFIVIHQTYELWFKQILHEMTLLRESFLANDATTALTTLKRILTILKTLVSQVDILETMTPLSFGSFRALLESSSGFQSVQFRELEIVLGNRDAARIRRYPLDATDIERLTNCLKEASLYDAFLHFLNSNGCPVPRDILKRDMTATYLANQDVQNILVELYRTNAPLTQICERLVDLDEGFQEWRYRHVKMVERTIGVKAGTGGSLGVEYLKSTLFKPVFPDLWAIRKEF